MSTSSYPAAPGDLTPDEWAQLLAVLSLGAAPEFYGLMGVPTRDPATFQRALRATILDARGRQDAEPDHIPPVAEMFADRLQTSDAEAFLRWARGVFLGYHADQPEWSAWDIVFSQWAYSRRGDLGFLPTTTRDALVVAYREIAETDDVRERCERAAERPLSDWDVEVYARRGYGAEWESGPYSTIEAVCRIERLKQFVSVVWPELTPQERAQLHDRAEALLAELGVWMPGPLPQLDTLLGNPG